MAVALGPYLGSRSELQQTNNGFGEKVPLNPRVTHGKAGAPGDFLKFCVQTPCSPTG